MKDFEQLQRENLYLKQLLARLMNNQSTTDTCKIVTKMSTTEEKVHLLKSLFKARSDVFALRWESKSGGTG